MGSFSTTLIEYSTNIEWKLAWKIEMKKNKLNSEILNQILNCNSQEYWKDSITP